MKRLRGFCWPGGKNVVGNHGLTDWILGELPDVDKKQTYVEPFAGMLGVLLNRAPVPLEIVNDLDERIVNWWTVAREQPDLLAEQMLWTPNSRSELNECFAKVSDFEVDPVERARCFAVICSDGYSLTRTHWRRRFDGKSTARGGFHHIRKTLGQLAGRLRHVQLENRDAVTFLEGVPEVPDGVMYVDPPYGSVNGGEYYQYDVDRVRLAQVLGELSVKGWRIALSGYEGDDLGLGWRCVTKPVSSTLGSERGGRTHYKRVEHLWLSYDKPQQKLF